MEKMGAIRYKMLAFCFGTILGMFAVAAIRNHRLQSAPIQPQIIAWCEHGTGLCTSSPNVDSPCERAISCTWADHHTDNPTQIIKLCVCHKNIPLTKP